MTGRLSWPIQSRFVRGFVAVLQAIVLRIYWLFFSPHSFLPGSPRKILVFGYMGIGDFILFSPTLRGLRSLYPQSVITFITGPGSGVHSLVSGYSEIDRILEVDWQKMKPDEKSKIDALIQNENFDLVVGTYIAPIRFFLWALRNVPVRLGSVREIKSPRLLLHPLRWIQWFLHFYFLEEEFFRNIFFNKKIVIPHSGIHEIDKGLGLLHQLSGRSHFDRNIQIPIDKSEEDAAVKLFSTLQIQGISVIAIHPWASRIQAWKQWPLEKYKRLCHLLIQDWDVKIILLGTSEELGQNKNEIDGFIQKGLIIVPIERVPFLCSVIRRCVMLIGGDSGPGHIAVASDIPSVRLFGPTDIKTFQAEASVRHKELSIDISCRPCVISGFPLPDQINYRTCGQRPCLQDMEVDYVYNEVSDLLKKLSVLKRKQG